MAGLSEKVDEAILDLSERVSDALDDDPTAGIDRTRGGRG